MSDTPTPDATLDGLLRKRDEACYMHEVKEANVAIHAYVAQRERDAEKEVAQAYDRGYADAEERLIPENQEREREKDAEIARLREALRDVRESAANAESACINGWIREYIDAALASPPQEDDEPFRPRLPVPPETVEAMRELAKSLGADPDQIRILGVRPEDAEADAASPPQEGA